MERGRGKEKATENPEEKKQEGDARAGGPEEMSRTQRRNGDGVTRDKVKAASFFTRTTSCRPQNASILTVTSCFGGGRLSQEHRKYSAPAPPFLKIKLDEYRRCRMIFCDYSCSASTF